MGCKGVDQTLLLLLYLIVLSLLNIVKHIYTHTYTHYYRYINTGKRNSLLTLIFLPFFINKVFTDLMKSKRLTENDLKKIDIVLSQDAEQPFHKGNLHSLNGSFIGLPSSFSDSYTSS